MTSSLAHILIILILGSSLLLVRLGDRPLGGSEGRWGEIAREMLLTHNWIVPKINGNAYRDKPAGSYWFITLLSLPKNRVTETTTRLPSALAILLSALLLYGISSKFWDGKIALLTAFIFLTTYPIIFWGRTANADTLTLAGTLACVEFFLRSWGKSGTNLAWLYPFFIVAGITSLMKGLLGFVLPSLCVFPYLLIKTPSLLRSKRFFLHLLCSFLIGLSLFLIPPLFDYETTHAAQSFYLIFKENIIRFFHPFDHKGPFFYYFYYIFVTVSPWSLFIPFLVVSLKRHEVFHDEGNLFFGTWFVLLFTFFTLSGSKRGYYLMPVIPAFSALLAHAFQRMDKSGSSTKLGRFLIITPVSGILACGIIAVLLPFFPAAGQIPREIIAVARPYAIPVGGIMIVAGGVSLLFLKKEKVIRCIYTLGMGIFILFCVAFWAVFPAIAKKNPFVPFCRKVNMATRGGAAAVYGSADRSILYFYLDKIYLPYIKTPVSARRFLEGTPHSYLIVKGQKDLNSLNLKHPKVIVSEKREGQETYLLVSLQGNGKAIQ